MKNHHLRYIISLALLATLPEIYFLSKLSSLKIILIFVVAIICLLFMIPADIGISRGGKTNPRKWIWEFNKDSIIGFKPFNLPIEEYLFVLVWIPLMIAMWEYVKNMQIRVGLVAGILVLCLVMIHYIYPALSKPDK
jgi:lycopene cyclase domain-containing protein